jgi:hypothetical protein
VLTNEVDEDWYQLRAIYELLASGNADKLALAALVVGLLGAAASFLGGLLPAGIAVWIAIRDGRRARTVAGQAESSRQQAMIEAEKVRKDERTFQHRQAATLRRDTLRAQSRDLKARTSQARDDRRNLAIVALMETSVQIMTDAARHKPSEAKSGLIRYQTQTSVLALEMHGDEYDKFVALMKRMIMEWFALVKQGEGQKAPGTQSPIMQLQFSVRLVNLRLDRWYRHSGEGSDIFGSTDSDFTARYSSAFDGFRVLPSPLITESDE